MKACRIAWSPGEARIAVCDGSTLIDFALWRPGCPDGYGDLHLVRVQTAMPALGGAFVTLADGTSGFLTGLHKEGALQAARVTRSAQNGKGLRLKPLNTRYDGTEARLLSRGPSPLDDLATRYPDLPLCCDDPSLMALIPPPLRSRIARIPHAFDAELDATCEALLSRDTMLSHGMRATITPTPALIAIDLDDPHPDARRHIDAFTANRECFVPLVREIRMRNLSGAILIDPAGVPQRKRAALGPFLARALEGDPMHAKLLGATSLGLLEVVRTRGRPPLHELTNAPEGHGLAALRQILRTRPNRNIGAAPTLQASLAVSHALERNCDALDDFARAYGARLTLKMEPSFPDSHWSFTP